MSIPTRAAAFAVLTLLCACGGKPEAPPPNQAAPATTLPAVAVQPAAPAQAAVGEIGVPECDDFLAKYFACVDGKVPDAARPMLRQSIEQTKSAWKKAAATPEGKAGLAQGCKMAHEQAKTSMSAYSCSW